MTRVAAVAVFITAFGVARAVFAQPPPVEPREDRASTLSTSDERVETEQAPPSGPPTTTAPRERGFILRSADGASTLRTLALLQLRLDAPVWHRGDEDLQLGVQRVRVGLMGSVFTPALQYMFVVEYAGASVRPLFLTLDYAVVPGRLHVRVGQFKLPFSRAFVTMASQLALIERPLANAPAAFGDGVALGAMLHNGAGGRFEYAAGVWQGTGNGPVGSGPVAALRVGYNAGALEGYSEGDLVGGPVRVGAGAAALVGFGTHEQEPFRSGVLDVLVKAHGFSLAGTVHVGDSGVHPRVVRYGHSLQLGHVLFGRAEPVLRYERLTVRDEQTRRRVTAGLNLYLHGHGLKLQTALSADFVDGQRAPRLRLQVQLSLAL